MNSRARWVSCYLFQKVLALIDITLEFITVLLGLPLIDPAVIPPFLIVNCLSISFFPTPSLALSLATFPTNYANYCVEVKVNLVEEGMLYDRREVCDVKGGSGKGNLNLTL